MMNFELARAERELNKPINWGQRTFYNLLERYGTPEPSFSLNKTKTLNNKNNNRKTIPTLAPPKRVQEALEKNPTISGPLNGSEVLNELTEIEQCDFFSRFPECEILILQNWITISDNVLRAISITMGEGLVEIDVSGSHIKNSHFEILLSRVKRLKVLKVSNCPYVDGACMMTLATTSHKTLTELYADQCAMFHLEPLLWLAGCVGINSQKLDRIKILDLARCPLEDRALTGVASSLHLIKMLNLEQCVDITDVGVCAIAAASPKLTVINLAGCLKITTKSANALAKHCKALVSINLNRCINVHDNGISAIANCCTKLQALNIAGLKSLSEGTLCALALNCPGLLMLNITGCEEITISGLRQLISGLKYVEEAQTYLGFKPIDEHVDKKLSDQLFMIKDQAATIIGRNIHAMTNRIKTKKEYELARIDNAARVLQRALGSYRLRLKFYYIWKNKKGWLGSMLIQRIWRGFKGRKKAKQRKQEHLDMLARIPHIIKIQKIFRSVVCRKHNKYIAQAIRDMYDDRGREAEIGVAVRFQSLGRRFLALRRISAWREFVHRRRNDQFNAATVLQCMVRCFLSKTRKTKLMTKRNRIRDLKNRAAARIQAFYRASQGKYNSKLTRQELLMIQRRRLAAAMRISRVVRGHWGRKIAQKIRIRRALEYCAAREIQRVYRGRRVMCWRDMKMNIVASFILDRQYLERQERVAAARWRYQNYLEECRKDSASDSLDEDPAADNKWTQVVDEETQVSRWINVETGEVTYEEPEDPDAFVKAILNARVKVLWLAHNEWFEGTITKYHRRKKRHRIDYDDGDHEWLNVQIESERIQIQLPGGSWTMIDLYKPPEVQRELEKRSIKNQKQQLKDQAYRDATQWRIISDDVSDRVMFISDISGLIRTGAEDARLWQVRDDGFGFPCFYNTETEQIVFEDPRFSEDVSEDVQYQRDYVMQELRYAMYFCKDMYAKYENATYMKDKKRIQSILKNAASSNKVKLLTAFLIRAKNLYKPVSVMDPPPEPAVVQELEYASWLAERMSEIVDEGNNLRRVYQDTKLKVIDTVLQVKNVYDVSTLRNTNKVSFSNSVSQEQMMQDEELDRHVEYEVTSNRQAPLDSHQEEEVTY